MTHTPGELRALLERHGVRPSRALGQHFLVDAALARSLVRLAGVGPGHRVVEIGAGAGSLTRALVDAGAEVVAVERDRNLLPVLTEVVGDTATIVGADALALDWAEALDGPGWVLVANLPYNVATPLVLDTLDHVAAVDRLVVMVQREVAERLTAGVGDEAYGIPSVKVASWAEARTLTRVGPEVFWPRPRVRSAVIELVRRQRTDPGVDRTRLFTLVRAGFGQRRKMLRRSLAGLVTPAAFAAAGVAGDQRAEQVDLAGWVALAATPPPAETDAETGA